MILAMVTPPNSNITPEKMMVGRRSFPIRKATFQGRTVKLREGSGFVYPVSWSQRLKKRFTATKKPGLCSKEIACSRRQASSVANTSS